MKNKIQWFAIIPAVFTGGLINLFLNRKIIDYPRGTPEGGRVAAIGVFVIIISVTVISYLIFRIKKYIKGNSNNV